MDQEEIMKDYEADCKAYEAKIAKLEVENKRLKEGYKMFPVIKKWVKSKSNIYDKHGAILQACDYAQKALEE
jgi:hypothetical protein